MAEFKDVIWRCPICETINRNEKRCVVCGNGYFAETQNTDTKKPILNDDAGPEPYKTLENAKSLHNKRMLDFEDKLGTGELTERDDINRTEESGIFDLHKLSKSYRMRSLDDIEGKKEEISEAGLKLREISKSYRMKSLDALEG